MKPSKIVGSDYIFKLFFLQLNFLPKTFTIMIELNIYKIRIAKMEANIENLYKFKKDKIELISPDTTNILLIRQAPYFISFFILCNYISKLGYPDNSFISHLFYIGIIFIISKILTLCFGYNKVIINTNNESISNSALFDIYFSNIAYIYVTEKIEHPSIIGSGKERYFIQIKAALKKDSYDDLLLLSVQKTKERNKSNYTINDLNTIGQILADTIQCNFAEGLNYTETRIIFDNYNKKFSTKYLSLNRTKCEELLKVYEDSIIAYNTFKYIGVISCCFVAYFSFKPLLSDSSSNNVSVNSNKLTQVKQPSIIDKRKEEAAKKEQLIKNRNAANQFATEFERKKHEFISKNKSDFPPEKKYPPPVSKGYWDHTVYIMPINDGINSPEKYTHQLKTSEDFFNCNVDLCYNDFFTNQFCSNFFKSKKNTETLNEAIDSLKILLQIYFKHNALREQCTNIKNEYFQRIGPAILQALSYNNSNINSNFVSKLNLSNQNSFNKAYTWMPNQMSTEDLANEKKAREYLSSLEKSLKENDFSDKKYFRQIMEFHPDMVQNNITNIIQKHLAPINIKSKYTNSDKIYKINIPVNWVEKGRKPENCAHNFSSYRGGQSFRVFLYPNKHEHTQETLASKFTSLIEDYDYKRPGLPKISTKQVNDINVTIINIASDQFYEDAIKYIQREWYSPDFRLNLGEILQSYDRRYIVETNEEIIAFQFSLNTSDKGRTLCHLMQNEPLYDEIVNRFINENLISNNEARAE